MLACVGGYLWRCDRRSSKRVSVNHRAVPSSATILVVCGAPSRLLRASSSAEAPDSDLDRLVASFFKLDWIVITDVCVVLLVTVGCYVVSFNDHFAAAVFLLKATSVKSVWDVSIREGRQQPVSSCACRLHRSIVVRQSSA